MIAGYVGSWPSSYSLRRALLSSDSPAFPVGKNDFLYGESGIAFDTPLIASFGADGYSSESASASTSTSAACSLVVSREYGTAGHLGDSESELRILKVSEKVQDEHPKPRAAAHSDWVTVALPGTPRKRSDDACLKGEDSCDGVDAREGASSSCLRRRGENWTNFCVETDF
jgi:hypothetical protein